MSAGPPLGPGTKFLIIGLVACSVIFRVTDKFTPLGVGDLVFTVDGMYNFEFWRIVTYPMIELSPLRLIISGVVLYFFGRFFEAQWGTRDYVRFFFASTIGGAIIAMPLSFLINMLGLFADAGEATGPNAAFDAMLVALALSAPNSQVLFGFMLPVKTRTLVYLLLGFQLLAGIMTGVSALAITLGGMSMGYLLTTGTWRPERLIARIKLWRVGKRRRGLYVVPPKDDPTLH